MVFIGLFILVDNVTIIARPELIANYRAYPLLWTVPAFTLVTMILIGVFNEAERFGSAFVASSLTIVGLMGMVATAIFPNIIPASNDPALSLTIGNASSSELTLKVMFIVAVVGMPIVLIYTIWIYRVFRGKVSASDEGEGY